MIQTEYSDSGPDPRVIREFLTSKSEQKLNDALQSRYARRISEPGVTRIVTVKIGRNDVCPCGSGKKYKKCCLAITEVI